jgi:hypothetical protein
MPHPELEKFHIAVYESQRAKVAGREAAFNEDDATFIERRDISELFEDQSEWPSIERRLLDLDEKLSASGTTIGELYAKVELQQGPMGLM